MNYIKMQKTDASDLKSEIFFYFRQKLYNHMLNAAKEGTSKYEGDTSFHLYHNLALILINRVEEGIHNLEGLLMENDIKLAVTISLMYAHKLLGNTSKDLFVKLDAQMKEHRKTSEAVEFYHSAFVLLSFNKFEKALDYIDKALVMKIDMYESLTLKGWILLQLNGSRKSSDNIKDLFQRSLQLNPRYLDTVIGYSENCLLQNDFPDALNVANKAIVRYTGSNFLLLQKVRIQLAMLDWDQAMETINRVSTTDPKNLYLKKLSLIISLCRSDNHDEALEELETFDKLLNSAEPKNIEFNLAASKLFSRICGRDTKILTETAKMLETSLQHSIENSELIAELGYQFLLRGKTKEASRYFKNATKIDETCFEALVGLSLCELHDNGITDQLKNQVDFLLEMKQSQDPTLHYLQAKMCENSSDAIKHLKTICEIKLSNLKNFTFSDNYLLTLDPDFSLDVVKEYMRHIAISKNSQHSLTDSILEILKVIVRACPGLSEASFLLAKLQYIKGDNATALNILEKILGNIANPQSEAQLLMAQIQVQQGFFERAMQSLETCVSHDFKIRENPIYHYIMGLIDKNTSNFGDAIKSLSTALSLTNTKSSHTVSLVEKASIYVELIDTLNIVGQTEEASKILEDATDELKGTPEEARILILSAEHLLKRKNIQGAIDILNTIKSTDMCYKEAKAKHAEILLNYRKDKYAYIQCYQDFVDENADVESYIMLGDAYMTVLEPDSALECYEKALKLNPKDPYLTSKMGQALVETHYFSKGVSYYKETIKNTNDSQLKLQLAELYMNLREYDKGEMLLLAELEEEKVHYLEDLTYLQYKTKLLILLSQIQERSGNVSHALKSLKEAMGNQTRVKKRLTVDQDTVSQEETQMIIDISLKLGEMAIALKNYEQATNFYKDGLVVSPNNVTILIALANLYIQMNYLELCQQTCSSILRIDPTNETASVMMADIAFRKIDFDMALFHFSQLISKQATNWKVLIRLIEILRRTGNITDCAQYLSAAEAKCENPAKESKYLYCLGLYQWYSGNLNGALKNFNGARQDSELGLQAIYNMIEICLNPDDEMFTEQFIESDDIEYKDSRTMALKTAEKLLRELKQKLEANNEDTLKYRLLSNFRLLATREKLSIESALDDLISLTSDFAYKDNIGITLGIATAYTLLKQSQRAKNQLKRFVKTPWTFEDAEYLERCWLLLADYYIQSAKYDIAGDLINKIVQHNKACMKAYEYLGFISEKEQRYKEAANHYEQTWKFSGKMNPAIGFKLAYCLMKCKRYPDAVDTAQEVLKISPEYPRIKKDILDKCMNNLRV